MKVANLDDTTAFSALDPAGMLPTVLSFPEMLETARRLALDAHLIAPQQFRSIVVSGLGGSAIGGDLVRALLLPWLRIPMTVNREYGVPGFVGEHRGDVGRDAGGPRARRDDHRNYQRRSVA